jgi:carboxyl-terminal processing protease
LVVAPIDDTPAARAGIRSGDVIVAIDGESLDGQSQAAAVERMRGAPGSPVKLSIEREGEARPLEVSLVREIIRVASVRERLLEPGFVYLRIAAFQSDTAAELKRKLAAAVKQSGEVGLKGLVLDLRSNPGGLLNAGIEVADAFLEAGQILSTRGRLPYASSEFRASPGDIASGAPIVVLTDGGTASAAEVVAGALRDHRRALVMGSTSFGKGSVQTVLPVDNGDSIKLTTARYYTPNGTSIQAHGIVPDIVLDEGLELRRGGETGPRLRERDLPGHLESEHGAAEAAAAEAGGIDDFAVLEALNLLKGLALFGSRPVPAAD